MRPAARRARVVVLALGAVASGCTTAVWSDTRVDAGQLAAIPRAGEARELPDKAAVLARLGPPADVLAPGAGDVFVYRLLQVDERLLQFNAALLAGPAVPIVADYDRRARSDVLFVFFDSAGRVTQTAYRRVVQGGFDGFEPEQAPAAGAGPRVAGEVE